MAYSTFLGDEDIWSVDIRNSSKLRRLIASSLIDRAPQPSPDGKRIAFLSTRSGIPRIWISDSDGRNASDVAAAGRFAAVPRWSPDSREIAFECRFGENDEVCAVSSEGGPPRRLTFHASRDILPSWSRDGRFVYFTSDRSAGFRIWKVPTRGEDHAHPALQVTRDAGYGAVESPDGNYLYYTKSWLDGRVARIPIAGGEETLMADSVRSLRMPQNFALAAKGIYYAFSTDPQTWFEIRFSSYDAGGSATLLRMQRGIGNGMSLAPDGRTLLFSAVEPRGGDLMLVDNFR